MFNAGLKYPAFFLTMMYSKKHNFVCMTCPKTGSTSIREFLKKEYKVNEWYYQGIDSHLANEHVTHLPEQFKDYFVLAMVEEQEQIEADQSLLKRL